MAANSLRGNEFYTNINRGKLRRYKESMALPGERALLAAPRALWLLVLAACASQAASFVAPPAGATMSALPQTRRCLFENRGVLSLRAESSDDAPRSPDPAAAQSLAARQADLSSRIKFFGPTATLARNEDSGIRAPSGTPVYRPSEITDGAGLVERVLLDFSDDAGIASALKQMERFDDQIMGGISQSTIVRGEALGSREPCGIFGGVVRVQGGGFAGCRMKMLKTPLDLSDYAGMYIRCRGDGKRYKLNMRCSPTSNEVVYQAEFQPPADAEGTVRIPFSAFRLVKRSVPIPGPPLGVNTIYQMGLVLSKFSFGEDDFNPTFQPGLFRLQISAIGAYSEVKSKTAYVDERSAAQGPALSIPDDDVIEDSLRFKPDGSKRSWVKRALLGRVRRLLRSRVAARRTAVAEELLEARRKGVRLSDWRKNSA